MNNFYKYNECFDTDLPIHQLVKHSFVMYIICSDKHNTLCALLKVWTFSWQSNRQSEY